jgi:hypothetical protein
MDLIMESKQITARGTSRLGQRELEDWSKGNRGTGSGGAEGTGARRTAGLSQGEQEDCFFARGSSRTRPRGARKHWKGEPAD